MRIGYFLSCEEYSPTHLIEQARMAEDAGFDSLWISDHFHPWNDEQGQSAFVWSMIGAISQVTDLPITTAVTCPTIRIHPALVAQAAATSQVLTDGRFRLGVGTGEALNEHVTGARWPDTDERLHMLEEAVTLMRLLGSSDTPVHFTGEHYRVEDARIYTRHPTPVPIFMSGFGPKATEVAGRIADGFVCTQPDADLVGLFRESGGHGKTVQGGYKVCWAPSADEATETAHRLWANEQLPGELAQVLSSPKHFEQASTLVTPQMVADAAPMGNDVDEHVEAFGAFVEAGFDEIHISQMGGARPGTSYQGFFEAYKNTVLPKLRSL